MWFYSLETKTIGWAANFHFWEFIFFKNCLNPFYFANKLAVCAFTYCFFISSVNMYAFIPGLPPETRNPLPETRPFLYPICLNKFKKRKRRKREINIYNFFHFSLCWSVVEWVRRLARYFHRGRFESRAFQK